MIQQHRQLQDHKFCEQATDFLRGLKFHNNLRKDTANPLFLQGTTHLVRLIPLWHQLCENNNKITGKGEGVRWGPPGPELCSASACRAGRRLQSQHGETGPAMGKAAAVKSFISSLS